LIIPLNSSYDILIIFVLSVIAILISFLTYNRVSTGKIRKILLISLRTVTIFLILILLSSPVIIKEKIEAEKSVNVFLIDNSLSMKLEKRDSITRDLLIQRISGLSTSITENKFFLFSGKLSEEITVDDFADIYNDSIDNFSSNISVAFDNLNDLSASFNISSVTVISDGIINEGGTGVNSVLKIGVPVNYFLIGDTNRKKDISVRKIRYNKVSYSESLTPVETDIQVYGYTGRIQINLYEEDKLVNSTDVFAYKEQNLYSVKFNLFSAEAGIKKFRISAENIEGEVTYKNNYKDFFVKFTDNKIKVLILSGGPSPDYAFFKQEILKINNVKLSFLTQKSKGTYYESLPGSFSDYDVILLFGYPTDISDKEILLKIKELQNSKITPLIFVSSGNVNYLKLKTLEDYLPFFISGAASSDFLSKIRFVENDNKLSKEINPAVFPPVYIQGIKSSVKPLSESLIVSENGGEPVFIENKDEIKKSAALLCYNFYKWRLNPELFQGSKFLNNLLSYSFLSLINPEKQSKFSFGTTRDTYSPFDDVVFYAYLNEKFPEGDLKVKINIYENNNINIHELQKINMYEFKGNVKIKSKGDYTYTAELLKDDKLIEKGIGKFSVSENNFEYENIKPDERILRTIADATNGKNFTDMEVEKIKEFLYNTGEQKLTKIVTSEKVNLNFYFYYLLVIIVLAGTEWFVRKRSNLP